jgi:hypothetical protein
MREYKREKATLEAQLKDVQKRSADHDDHLRIIDAWWSQVRYIQYYWLHIFALLTAYSAA